MTAVPGGNVELAVSRMKFKMASEVFCREILSEQQLETLVGWMGG